VNAINWFNCVSYVKILVSCSCYKYSIILTKSTCGLFELGRLCLSTHRGMCKMSIKDEINFPIVSYPFVCINIPVAPPYVYVIFQYRRVCKYQRGNQKRISKKKRQHNGQKKKVQKDKQWSTKHTYPISNFHIKDCYEWSTCLNRLSWLIDWLIDCLIAWFIDWGFHDS
jgi:hypothetical protein